LPDTPDFHLHRAAIELRTVAHWVFNGSVCITLTTAQSLRQSHGFAAVERALDDARVIITKLSDTTLEDIEGAVKIHEAKRPRS
jgi:hypothetical protein